MSDEHPTGQSLPADEIPRPEDLIPHRPPFLFIDRLIELIPGDRVVGTWTITGDEDFLVGHFPGRPTLPGVLMLEALAQVGACGALSDPEHAGKLPLFGGVDGVRFRRQVVPGDTLQLEVTLGRLGRRGGKASARALLDGEPACTAELMVVLVDP